MTIVEKDHAEYKNEGYSYCPYCAYPLKKQKEHFNFEYKQAFKEALKEYNAIKKRKWKYKHDVRYEIYLEKKGEVI